MTTRRSRYLRHRFPPDSISYAVWLYHRYCLSFRDVEDLLAERGLITSYETVRRWCRMFGPDYTRRLKRRHGRLGDTWFLDEVFVLINGHRQYLWRAVNQDGDVIDILVQPRRDGAAAQRSFRRFLKGERQASSPISWAATVSRIRPSCPSSCTTPPHTRTTVPRSRINRPDNGSVRCEASDRQPTRSASSCAFTPLFRICFAWVATT